MTIVGQFSARIPLGSQVFAEIETKPPAVGMVYRIVDPDTGAESVIRIVKEDPQSKVVSYFEVFPDALEGKKRWWRPRVGWGSLLMMYQDHQVFEIGVRNRKWWEQFLTILAAVKESGATFGEAVEILCTLRTFEFMQERGDDTVIVHGEVPMSDRPVNFSGGVVKVETPLTLETLGR